MKTATKAVTATASAGSAIGGGYTIYHFSSESGVSTEEETSLKNLTSDEVSSKILKDENDIATNETVDIVSKEKQGSKSEVAEAKKTIHKQAQQKVDEFSELKKGLKTYSSSDLSNEAYKDKLLGITKESNLPKLVKFDDNKKWWEWAFKNKHESKKNDTTLHSLFSSLKKGYSEAEGDDKALNQACKEAYNKSKSDYSFDDNHFLLRNISDFCTSERKSFDISEPRSELYTNNSLISSYQDGLMGVGENKSVLVDPWQRNENYNDLWWKWSYKYKVKSKTNLTSYFSNLAEGYTDDAQGGLNGACHKLYGMSLDQLRKENEKLKLLKEVQQFCSFNKNKRLVVVSDSEPAVSTFNLPSNKTLNAKYTNKILDLIDLKNLMNFVQTDVESNAAWWEWMFENHYLKETFHPWIKNLFKEINEGYSKTNPKALNKVCENAYQGEKSDYSFGSPIYFLNYAGKFCTNAKDKMEVLKPKYLTFADEKAYFGLLNKDSGLLSKQNNFSNLVPATKFSENPQEVTYWWEWVFAARFPNSNKDRQALSSVFKVVDMEYGGGDSDRTALNQACKIAYKKNLSEFKGAEENQKLLKDVQQFCTVDPTLALTVQ